VRRSALGKETRGVIKEPLFVEAKLEPRVWGGRRLAGAFGRELPDGPVGESWEIHGDLRVIGLDRTLDQLVEELGSALVGTRVDSSAGFPLLTKWLDCQAWLSVQVHPDDDLAREFTGDPRARGKTEAWYVHQAGDEAELIHGLAADVEAEQLRMARGEAILPLLSRFVPRAGQLLFTPAGQVHALGPGTLIYEVQQSCDLTYRFYDWGRDRELHLEKAVDCVLRSELVSSTISERSLSCPYFCMELVEGPLKWEVPPESFQILAATVDSELEWSGGSTLLRAGQSVLLPAGLGQVEAEGKFLKVGIP